MSKITFQVEPDEASGWYVASWDAPGGEGGITTQGRDLQANVREAVRCHFQPDQMPREIHLHLVADPVLIPAEIAPGYFRPGSRESTAAVGI
jgi:hypothetical protein